MSELQTVLLVSWLAGLAAFLGGVAARAEGSADTTRKREFIHGVVAFGGGILLGAVAFALAPEAIRLLPTWLLALTFLGGGFVFCAVDACLARRSGSVAQFMAMLLDFLPEAVSLGAVFGHNHRLGLLLAAYIGAQNLPEGFNSFRELAQAGGNTRTALLALFGISFLGPVMAAAGYFVLDAEGMLTAGIMSFAGGGILYLVFQDIAPQSRMRRRWIPPLGAVLGFLGAMLGKQLIGG
jgi:ZIP family zinc transporter